MILLDGLELKELPITGLKFVRELDRHEGPLLVQYEHPRGDQYLYYWCGCDETATRWMLARVSESSILRLISQAIPLDLVLPKGILDDFVYFVDTGKNYELVTMVAIRNVPPQCLPGKGAYIDVPETANERSYFFLIEASLTVDWIGELPKAFSRAYAVLYSLFILKPQSYPHIPSEKNYSGPSFYKWLLRIIPGEDRPEVTAYQYASPGFIKFELDRSIAEMVAAAVTSCKDSEVDMQASYNRLYGYIKEKQLNKLYRESPDSDEWQDHSKTLFSMTRRLLDSINY